MSILDELKAQASQQAAALDGFSCLQEKQENDYRSKILPKMQFIYAYLKKVVDYLAVIETPIEVKDYCEKLPALGNLQQQNYRLTTDQHGGIADFEKLKEVNLFFDLKASGYSRERDNIELVYTIDNMIDVKKEHSFLTKNNIPFKFDRSLKLDKESATTFRVKRSIPIAFQFSIDVENLKIVLKISNHENFESTIRLIEPEQINEAYLDKLASYILRKDSSLLVKKMDDSSREKIRLRLKEEKEEKERLLEISRENERKKQQLIEEKKLTYKIKTFFQKKPNN